MANRKTAEQIKEDRASLAAKKSDELHKENEPAVKAREERDEAVRELMDKEHEKEVELAEALSEVEEESKGKVHKLSAKPGSAAGLKPGDWFAPSSNPGAAAMVPTQPLQPESLQSHGKGILADKDLDNPPYNVGDPLHTDEGPSGSGSPSNLRAGKRVDKAAERKKAEGQTSRARTMDPDNPTMTGSGKPDPTASPLPIGTRGGGKNSRSGGSNPGI